MGNQEHNPCVFASHPPRRARRIGRMETAHELLRAHQIEDLRLGPCRDARDASRPQAGTGPASTPASTSLGGTAAPAGNAPTPSPQITAPASSAPGSSGAAVPATAGASAPVGATPGASSTPAPAGSVDVAAILDGKAKGAGQTLNWRHSIVDLLKLLDLDSSLSSRQELAKELGYTGDPRRLGRDEHLAASSGDDQARGQRRHRAGRASRLTAAGRPQPAARFRLKSLRTSDRSAAPVAKASAK